MRPPRRVPDIFLTPAFGPGLRVSDNTLVSSRYVTPVLRSLFQRESPSSVPTLESVAKVLLGEIEPSGRLPVTVPAAGGNGAAYGFGHGRSYR